MSVLALLPWAVAGAFLLRAPRDAAAHPEFKPSVVNRYLKITLLSPTAVRLAASFLYGEEPGQAARRAHDTDGNGRLDPAEEAGLAAPLAAAERAAHAVEVDGGAAPIAWEAPVIGLAGGAAGGGAFSVDLVGHLALAEAAEHRLVLSDRLLLPDLAPGAGPGEEGETEVRVEESPTTRLLQAGPDERPGITAQLRFAPRRSLLETRTVRVGYARVAPAAAPDGRRWPWLVALGAAALALGLGSRRYRRTKG